MVSSSPRAQTRSQHDVDPERIKAYSVSYYKQVFFYMKRVQFVLRCSLRLQYTYILLYFIVFVSLLFNQLTRQTLVCLDCQSREGEIIDTLLLLIILKFSSRIYLYLLHSASNTVTKVVELVQPKLRFYV